MYDPLTPPHTHTTHTHTHTHMSHTHTLTHTHSLTHTHTTVSRERARVREAAAQSLHAELLLTVTGMEATAVARETLRWAPVGRSSFLSLCIQSQIFHEYFY